MLASVPPELPLRLASLLLLRLLLLVLTWWPLLTRRRLIRLRTPGLLRGTAPLPTGAPLPGHELEAQQIYDRLSLVLGLEQDRIHRVLFKNILRKRIRSQKFLYQSNFVITASQGLPT